MNDDTFSNSPVEFKAGTIGSFGNYLLNTDRSKSGEYNTINVIDFFNESNTGGVFKYSKNYS
ncbi:hypothetical protein ACYSNM_13170 [Myroides sp. LJL116]